MPLVNRLLALVLGLALAVAGVIAIIEVSLLLGAHQPWLVDRTAWHESLEQLRWSDRPMTLGLTIALACGLALAFLQLVPRQPARLALDDAAEDRSTSVSRRGLQDRLREVVSGDPEVVEARVKVSRSRAAVRASVHRSTEPADVRRRLSESLYGSLDELALSHRLRVQVQLDESKARVR